MQAFTQVNQESDQFREAGLLAVKGGDTEGARRLFEQAGKVIGDFCSIDIGNCNDETSLKAAVLERDIGLTHLDDAVREDDEQHLAKAERQIKHSRHIINTTLEVVLEETEHLEDPYDYPIAKIERLQAEKGQSISALGRTATVGFHLFDLLQPQLVEEDLYALAQKTLKRANNGVYLVDNAMFAAREELLSGDEQGMKARLRDASEGVEWAEDHDPINLEATRLIIFTRKLELETREAAFASLRTNP